MNLREHNMGLFNEASDDCCDNCCDEFPFLSFIAISFGSARSFSSQRQHLSTAYKTPLSNPLACCYSLGGLVLEEKIMGREEANKSIESQL